MTFTKTDNSTALRFRIGRDCYASMHLVGEITADEIDKLIECLQMSRDTFPERVVNMASNGQENSDLLACVQGLREKK